MTAPRSAKAVLFATAFGVGVVIGGCYVAYATAHELFDRFIR